MTKKKLRHPRGKGANISSRTAAMGLSEIGKLFGVSLQSIQKIEWRALEKIKTAVEKAAAEDGVSIEEWLRR
jgi:DNA-directed RNA polymerase sigma subunit (sigma70/sigma32)